MTQVAKETIKNYEEEQGLQYQENHAHLDRDLVGPLIATFAHFQRDLTNGQRIMTNSVGSRGRRQSPPQGG